MKEGGKFTSYEGHSDQYNPSSLFVLFHASVTHTAARVRIPPARVLRAGADVVSCYLADDMHVDSPVL